MALVLGLSACGASGVEPNASDEIRSESAEEQSSDGHTGIDAAFTYTPCIPDENDNFGDPADLLRSVSVWVLVEDLVLDDEFGFAYAAVTGSVIDSGESGDALEAVVRIDLATVSSLEWGKESQLPIYFGLDETPVALAGERAIDASLAVALVDSDSQPIIDGSCPVAQLRTALLGANSNSLEGLVQELIGQVGDELASAALQES